MKYDPIPFDKRLLEEALELKQSGLQWTPEKGCFVWDPQAIIQAPSPFPNRVYFVLNLRRFIDIFGDIETMQAKLVWLPTWYQAIQLYRELEVSGSGHDAHLSSEADLLFRLYRQIARKLRGSNVYGAKSSKNVESENENRWLSEVIEAELGGLDVLPGKVQRWIRSLYGDVGAAYVGWRRIQANEGDQWLPPERSFDSGLLSDLGHFYSDYQHQIRTLETARQTVRLLRSVSQKTDPSTRNQLLQVLIDSAERKNASEGILDQLMIPIEPQAVS